MKRMLICGDYTSTALLSQYLPLAKCFSKEYELYCLCASPTSLQLALCLPHFKDIICFELIKETKTIVGMEKSKGLTFLLPFFDYNGPYKFEDFTIDQKFLDSFDFFDVIVLLIDSTFDVSNLMCQILLKTFPNKCIGRFHGWNKECSTRKIDKFIPEETVNSFSFDYCEDLIRYEIDPFREHFVPGFFDLPKTKKKQYTSYNECRV